MNLFYITPPCLALVLLIWGMPPVAIAGVGEVPLSAGETAAPVKAAPPEGYVPPKPLTTVDAAYPKAAFDANIETSVGLLLYIDTTGKVVKVELDKPAAAKGYGFNESAAEAVAKWVFEPAQQDGVPISVKIRYTYQFKIVFTKPVLKVLIAANYPAMALRQGITDEVLAHIDVDQNGAVTQVRVVEPAANKGFGFDRAAREAIKRFRFEPAHRNGIPTAVTIHYQYRFVLPEKWVPLASRPVNLVIELREKGTRKPFDEGTITLQRGDETPIEESFVGGRYEGRDLEPGEWRIRVQADGYKTVETTETLEKGKLREVRYLVKRLRYEVFDGEDKFDADEAYVYETRESKIEKEVSVQTIDVTEIQRLPGNQGDALKVIQNLPGVARSTFNLGEMIVRGSDPEDTIVLMDGAEIPMLYHFIGSKAVVNSDSLYEINFLPGNFSVRYGRAMGGVLDVKTRAPNKERYAGYLDLNLLDGSLMIEGPITDTLSFQVAVRRSWIDGVLYLADKVSDEIDLNYTVAPRYWDYQGRINWASKGRFQGKPIHEVELNLYGSDDALELVEPENKEDQEFESKFRTEFQRAQLKWSFSKGAIRNYMLHGFARDRQYFEFGESGMVLRSEILELKYSLRDQLTFLVSQFLDVTTGVDVVAGTYDTYMILPDFMDHQGGAPGPEGIDSDELLTQKTSDTFFYPAVFLEMGIKPMKSLRLVLGGRYDYDYLTGGYSVDGRSSVHYELSRYWSLKGGIGSYHQPPSPEELSEKFGNSELKPQYAMHYSLGFETRLPPYPALSLDVTGFHKRLYDLVAPSERYIVKEGEPEPVPEHYNNTGRGAVVGAEFLLRHAMHNNFFGWMAYTVSRATRQETPDIKSHLFDYDQTHILTLVGSYKFASTWQVGVRFRFVSGNPYTENSRGVFMADTASFEPVVGALNGARMPPFHQLDIRVDKDWVFDNWILTMYLDVQNTYIHGNPEKIMYNDDYTAKKYVEGIPFLPTIGIRGTL